MNKLISSLGFYMKKHKVAIFTAYYNRENNVSESISSLLNQTYDDFVVVAINDGSTDNTLSKMKDINDDRLIIIDKDNSGFVSSMIYAINKIDSEYIAIHGSGDISYPDRISLQVEVLDNNPNVGVVGCHYKNIDLTRNKSVEFHNLSGLIKGPEMAIQLSMKNPLTQGEVMLRRDVYNKVGGYNPLFIFSQDYDLWTRISKVTDFFIIPKVLYERYVCFDGVSGNVNKIAIQQYLASVARVNSFVDNYDINVLSVFKKINDPILSKRLIRLNVRAILYEKVYPKDLARINLLELGTKGLFFNLLLNICRLRRK